MAKDLKIALLLDYYGEMLTPKQRAVLRCYYDDDLSLSEIAQNAHITRQGVRERDQARRSAAARNGGKASLVEKERALQQKLSAIRKLAENVRDYNSRFVYDKSITRQMEKLLSALDALQSGAPDEKGELYGV